MIELRVTISPITRQSIALKTMKAAGRNAERLAEQSGRQMVGEAQRLVEARFETRSGDRRKQTSNTHLVDSFTYEIDRGPEPGGFPYTVGLIPKPELNDDDLAKLITHNWGRTGSKVAGYPIPETPGQPWLKFPELLNYVDESGAQKFPLGVTKSVFWKPKNQEAGGAKFLQRARDTVAAQLKRRLSGIKSPR